MRCKPSARSCARMRSGISLCWKLCCVKFLTDKGDAEMRPAIDTRCRAYGMKIMARLLVRSARGARFGAKLLPPDRRTTHATPNPRPPGERRPLSSAAAQGLHREPERAVHVLDNIPSRQPQADPSQPQDSQGA